MDIQLLKDNLRHIGGNNIIRLMSDVMLKNLDEIDNHSDNRMYYKNDIVYMYDEIEEKHKMYICKKNILQPGAFNESDWNEYIFKFINQKIILEFQVTAPYDNYSVFHADPIFDPDFDTVVLYHSLLGRLFKGKDWNFVDDTKTSFRLARSMWKNENIIIEIMKQ